MAYIMKFLINLLLFNRRMFKNLINDVIKSYLLKQQNKLAIQSNGILYRIDTHNPSTCDLNNLNLDYLALGVHKKIILPRFQYNRHNGIIKDSICFFSKKSNDGFDGDEKDIGNLDSLLKSHESLMNNLQTIIAKLETLNAELDPKEINEIKETLMTCIQILQSNTGKDKNIEELINQEIKQCRFVRKETMEFIEEISRYLKQIDSGSKLEQEQDQQSTTYFSGHDKFVDKKSTGPKSGDENEIVNTPLVLKRPIKPTTVNKTSILDSKKNPVGHYKGTKVAHISEHDIKLNEYKLSDSIIQFKNGDIILERMISDRKTRKPQNHVDKDPKSSNINKSSTAVIPITANSEIMEIVPPFETFEILQGKIQQYPGANIKALQVIEQPNDNKSFELDDEIVKKLDHTILFEKNCNDLVGMFQVCCNQTKKQTTKELVSKFNQSEIEYVCRNINMNDCSVAKIIEEYYKNIDLWWQRQQDYQHACKLLEIMHRHFEKSEKEINSKLPVIERWPNLTSLDDSSPTQSGIVEIKSDRSRSQQEKLAISKEIKSNVQNVSNIKETVQITKTEDRTKDGKSQITALQGSSTTYNKPNLSSSIYNKPNVKSTVQIAGTENKVKEEKSKEFATNSKTTNLKSPATYKPNLSTQNVQNVTSKITETGKRVEEKKGKEFEPKFKISNLETYNKPNLSTQNVQNVKTTSKITDAANRVQEEKGKEFGTKFKIPNLEIYNKPNFQKPTIKMSETEPSNTAKIIPKNELTKSTKTLINYKENKSTDSVKKELTSSLLKIPFKVTPNQSNFPNLSKSQMNTEKPPILKEKPPILTKKPPIQTERPEIETEKPQIQTKKPQTQKERISATKRVIGSRIPTKPTKIEPKTPNDNDKNSRSFSQIRKSYSTTDLKEQIEVTRTKPSETSLNKLKLIEQIKLKTTNSEKNLNKPKLKEEIRLTKTIQQSFTKTAKNLIKPKLEEQIKLTKTSQFTNSETAINKPKMKQTRVPLANNRLKRSSSWLIEKMSAFEMIPSRSYHEKSVKDDKYRETKSMIKKLQIEPEDQPISSNDNTSNLNRFKK